uniref:Basal body-orientation factor 1 n=1 Tax=Petromyzon marinus TaxID=7757 RepID=A0AAJ7SS99_PETMA|nr:basal body-orientation factor 1 isoform X2 [Petromyzon marinus]
MPKKKVKVKAKGAKQGKKKNKTGEHKERQMDREMELERACANATLWESRLEATERSRGEYREAARRMAQSNNELFQQLGSVERDSIDVISYMKSQDLEKDRLIKKLQKQIEDNRQEIRDEMKKLIDEAKEQKAEMELRLEQKSSEVNQLQSELRDMHEFRLKRDQMQQELDEITESMNAAGKNHKEALAKMERKFLEDKVRLEEEAGQVVNQLAEQAHTEAIMKLDETTQAVYKENVRLSEALTLHKNDAQTLRKKNEVLVEHNNRLCQEKEERAQLIREKVEEAAQQKEKLRKLQKKVETLEQSLRLMAREFEEERAVARAQWQSESQADRAEVVQLRHATELRAREMNRVKKLARNILDQRSDVEAFFLEALAQVQEEVAASRAHYKRAAQHAYQRKLQGALAGREEYPRVRTFGKLQHSTNSVYRDVEEAEKWNNITAEKVDICDLTWEQKERVLRVLFAKMNGEMSSRKTLKTKMILSAPAGGIPSVKNAQQDSIADAEAHNLTFITQGTSDSSPAGGLSLPAIRTGPSPGLMQAHLAAP